MGHPTPVSRRMSTPIWVSGARRPIVLHNFAYAMHKKTGVPLPVQTYPRLDRTKTGVFSIVAPAGDAANRGSHAIGVVLRPGAARNACYRRAGRHPPTQIACRMISLAQKDAYGAYAATPAC